MPPYIEPGDEGFKFMIDRFERGAEQGIETFIDERKARAGTLSPEDERRLRSLDLAAMAAVFRSGYLEGRDFRTVLPAMTMPTLLYVGDADAPTHSILLSFQEKFPNATLITLTGLDHAQANSASEQIVPHVREFLARFQAQR
jgi:pimeloyl-ACP methyl ester carboxylesterase